MTRELQRMIRHGVAPLTAYAVASGWLPEAMQQDVTELAVVALSLAAPYVWSWLREHRA